MNQIELINQLVSRLTSTFTSKESEIKTYLDNEVSNFTSTPGYTALREPQFYLQVYAQATTDFNQCSNHRIAIRQTTSRC